MTLTRIDTDQYVWVGSMLNAGVACQRPFPDVIETNGKASTLADVSAAKFIDPPDAVDQTVNGAL